MEFAERTQAPGLATNGISSIKCKNSLDNGYELFDSAVLRAVQSRSGAPKLPEKLRLRPLRMGDSKRGYLKLLGVSESDEYAEQQFRQRFYLMSRTKPQTYYVVVLENNQAQVIGTVTLIIELKYIHNLGARGRIKNLAIDAGLRAEGLGKFLNLFMIEFARHIGVYKISLGCCDELVTFFEQFGYVKDPGNNVMHFECGKSENPDKIIQIIERTSDDCSSFNGEVGDLKDTNYLSSGCKENEVFDSVFLEAVKATGRLPELPQDICLRPLQSEDYHKGFLSLLEQLTVVGEVAENDFKARFHSMREPGQPSYFVVVLENVRARKIVGSITLVTDIHGFRKHGHVEDVVVDSQLRGKKLGQLLNLCAIELARQIGVCTISLECKDRLLSFYERFGYVREGNFMVLRFDR